MHLPALLKATRGMGLPGNMPGMTMIDTSRNHRRRPGQNFTDALALPGWDEQSIWGYDEGTGSFFAQLWSNGSRSDPPEIWLSGAQTVYPWPGSIALAVVEKTRADPLAVVQALAIAAPEPCMRDGKEILSNVESLAAAADDPYLRGQVHALAWTQGKVDGSPGLRTSWCEGKPSAAQVDAEHHLVTGRVYRGEDRDFFAGADSALWWALGRIDDLL